MRRILQCCTQPPPGHGVMSLRYARIVEPLRELGWEMHHLGPDPAIDSAIDQLSFPRPCHGHYSRRIGWSRRASVERARTRGAARLAWSVVRAGFLVAGKLGLPDRARGALEEDLLRIGLEVLERDGPFDLILAAPDPMSLAEIAADLAARSGLPFALDFLDPIGSRDGVRFEPRDPDRQARLIARAEGVSFASPLTAERYERLFPVPGQEKVFLSDSFRKLQADEVADAGRQESRARERTRLVHAGNLLHYRPVGAFAEALRVFTSGAGSRALELVCAGINDPENLARLRAVPGLRLVSRPETSYREARRLQASADVLVAIIGPRHLDNVPSKFIEYLAYGRPVLVLGPPGNPVSRMVRELGVGVYCDVSSPGEIAAGLEQVVKERADLEEAFLSRREAVAQFDCARTADAWAGFFQRCIGRSRPRERPL